MKISLILSELRNSFLLATGLIFLSLSSCSKNPNIYLIKLDQSLMNDETYLHSLIEYWEKNEQPIGMNYDPNTFNENKVAFQTTFYNDDNLKIQPVMVRSADVETDRSKFRIGLMDTNMDGTFNQIGIDRLVLCKYQTDTLFMAANSRQIVPIRKNTVFQIDRDYYKITFFETDGSGIKLRRLPTGEWDRPITGLTTSLPRFMVSDHNGNKTGLWKLKDKSKPLLIINWHRVEKELNQEVQQLNRIYDKIKDRYSIIGINHWSEKEDIQIFEQMNAIPFPTYHVKDKYYAYLVNSSTNRILISLYDVDELILEDGIPLVRFLEKLKATD